MQVYPDIFQPSNISSFHKNKGKKNDDLNNNRGVFNVVEIRTILDKQILNDKYDTIDCSMGCSNIGARKGRNIRDHLFVLNRVLNELSLDHIYFMNKIMLRRTAQGVIPLSIHTSYIRAFAYPLAEAWGLPA